MAKEKKVEQITDMEVDFAQWYTDVCKKAELIDYSGIKGSFIYRPYGYAIWENMQKILDEMFKARDMKMFICRCSFRKACFRRKKIMSRALLQSAPG